MERRTAHDAGDEGSPVDETEPVEGLDWLESRRQWVDLGPVWLRKHAGIAWIVLLAGFIVLLTIALLVR